LLEALRQSADSAVDDFYGRISQRPKSRVILDMLDASELQHLKSQQVQNLLTMADPGIKPEDRVASAQRIGRIHAIVGLDKEELAQSHGILVDAVYRQIGERVSGQDILFLNQRLTDDLGWQLKAYQTIEDEQKNVLLDVMRITWENTNYTDLIVQLIKRLGKHPEIAGCAIGRPDEDGVFHFEVASENIQNILDNILDTPDTQVLINANDLRGQGPVGRAWRSGHVERVTNYKTEPQFKTWRGILMNLGLRSCAAVPLHAPGHSSVAVLLLHSALPGGFVGPHQISFLDMLQTLLGCALDRLGSMDGMRKTIPIKNRQHLSALVRSESLLNYYQPLLDTRSGKVLKVEALARLIDGRRMLSPENFLPALRFDDLLEIYIRVLECALSDKETWSRAGVDLELSLNFPPAGLSDIRYYNATKAALERHNCPPDQLTLEILESESVSLRHGQSGILSRFKRLGVQLAQDDLGSGHSGLTRLRNLPFDWIKIDRDMARIKDDDDARSILIFLHQLIRLGHSMGKQVVAEGIETTELTEALGMLGVDLIQGYAVGKPMPANEIAEWVQTHRYQNSHAINSALPELARQLVEET
jgi:EAL domain-containing protein (putative c-di-GMP-specific phosphodiesterase class I)/GAF domain-containing protein